MGAAWLLVLLAAFGLSQGQTQGINQCLSNNPLTCRECLKIGPKCSYCFEEGFTEKRCDLLENLQAKRCGQITMVRTSSEVVKSLSTSDMMSSRYAQVSPQSMNIKMRPGDSLKFDMQVIEPLKTPVDLYFLMDDSNSMNDDLDNLKKLGKQLAGVVQELSEDFHIGFGKFVDKVVAPQTDMRPEKLKQPWEDSDPPFSFKNVIPLTADVQHFQDKLQGERISGNRDAPEGGFDAMLQVAVCTKEIGWRNRTTHLLVFSTESAFHYEADGANVLAGILKRNDEQCHLTPDGDYTEGEAQDYPSVPTLVRLLGKNNIIPIFAVTQHAIEWYTSLAKFFPDSTYGELQEDSSNIIQLLQSSFKALRSKLQLQAEGLPRYLKAEFLQVAADGTEKDASVVNATPGQIVNYRVKLMADERYNDRSLCDMTPRERSNINFTLKPARFYDGLNINAEILCDCPCEATPVSNPMCSGNGRLTCGHCYCNDGWLGSNCNCSKLGTSQLVNAASCTRPGDSEPCSKRGDCVCGSCFCWPRPNPLEKYYGQYCECDNFQCPRANGIICNGRGDCSCGKCECSPGWTGEACQCPLGVETCRDGRGGICNGRGTCRCGVCECDKQQFSGSTCEVCLKCLGLCEDTRSCVQCQAWGTGEKKGDECGRCSPQTVMVDELKGANSVLEVCKFKDEEDGCVYHYTVENSPDDRSEYRIETLKKKECPAAGFLWLIPLIMLLIPLLGLLAFLCWKCCVGGFACCKGYQKVPIGAWTKGRTVGWTEDQYLFHQNALTADYVDTPLARAGPLGGPDIVKWKVTDNVHKPAATIPPLSMQETVYHGITLRLARLMNDNLAQPGTPENKTLIKEVEQNLNTVYGNVIGTQTVRNTVLRLQPNAGKRDRNVVVDTVLPAPRSALREIMETTEKQVNLGAFSKVPVVPGFYTVATDRDAHGEVEYQEGVDTQDVRVPLFVKEEDDMEKKLLVEATSVPEGLARITRRNVHITIIKDMAKSIVSFVQPAYTIRNAVSKVVVPVDRNILEESPAQIKYQTHDLSAIARQDYEPTEGVLKFTPTEKDKEISIPILPARSSPSQLYAQPRQFEVELFDPKLGARIGRYKRSIITLLDDRDPGLLEFSKTSQVHKQGQAEIHVPVVRTRGHDGDVRVKWKTLPSLPSRPSAYQNMSGELAMPDGEIQKSITIPYRQPVDPTRDDNFQVVMYEPSGGVALGQRKETVVTVSAHGQEVIVPESMQKSHMDMSGPENVQAEALNGKTIQINWTPPPGATVNGYKVRYWIDGEDEGDGQLVETKTTEVQLTSLYAYCDYLMCVYAITPRGLGPASEVVTCRTLEEVPGEPGRLAFTIVSATTLQLSWGEPPETNGLITGYEASYTPISEDGRSIGQTKRVEVQGNKRRVMLIENLRPMVPYRYLVRARNSAGWGPPRESTLNIANQSTRPLSIPIIPDVPIVDAQGPDDYAGFYMYGAMEGGGKALPSTSDDSYSYSTLPSKQGQRGGSSMTTSTTIHQSHHHQTMLGTLELPGMSGGSQHMHTLTRSTHGGSSTLGDAYGWDYSAGAWSQRGASSYDELDARELGSVVMETSASQVSTVLHESAVSYHSLQQTSHGAGVSMAGSRNRTQSEEAQEVLHQLDLALQPSPRSPAILGTPGIPEAPGRLVFSATGPTSLRVNWQKPQSDTQVMGYRVTYQPLSGGSPRNVEIADPNQVTVTVDQLLPNEAYLFKVMACSDKGWGPEREGVITIESQVNPASPHIPIPGSPFTLSTPNAPGPLVFTALTPSSLQLKWEKPMKPQGPIQGYVVSCEPVHPIAGSVGEPRIFTIDDQDETSLVVNDLLENVPYKFKVKTKTSQGYGPEREGIITIESQNGFQQDFSGGMDVMMHPSSSQQFVSQSSSMQSEVFDFPGEMMPGLMGVTQMVGQTGIITKKVTTVTKTTKMDSGTVSKQGDMRF
ncbi:integrin beta-4 isoform X2 [Petromyzon marinus]|nr:integrin beta-4 isoform X2 [Petromyzon marinus]XP_032823005.1 integrin beta-4 isoform X2 [Petromyzon marinus]